MKKFLLVTLVLAAFLSSCRKEELEKIDGPSLEEMYGVFGITDSLFISRDSVNFASNETVYFTASLTKTSDWKITITGLTSGAKKILTGTSKIINASEVIWDGSTTEFPIFKAEMCKVEMTFTGEADTMSGFIKVLAPKVNQGYLVTDFENGFDPGWSSFIQSGADMDFQIHSDVTSPEGGSYYNMAGTVNWDYLIGMVNFKASATGNVTYPLNTNGNAVYYNVMVYGEPGITNALLLFRLQEDENSDGTFDAATEDEYDYEIAVDWVGWKLVSVKYSDMVYLVNGAAGTPKGNQQHNPDKLTQIDMLHLANPTTGFSKTKVDYIMFTENAALKP